MILDELEKTKTELKNKIKKYQNSDAIKARKNLKRLLSFIEKNDTIMTIIKNNELKSDEYYKEIKEFIDKKRHIQNETIEEKEEEIDEIKFQFAFLRFLSEQDTNFYEIINSYNVQSEEWKENFYIFNQNFIETFFEFIQEKIIEKEDYYKKIIKNTRIEFEQRKKTFLNSTENNFRNSLSDLNYFLDNNELMKRIINTENQTNFDIDEEIKSKDERKKYVIPEKKEKLSYFYNFFKQIQLRNKSISNIAWGLALNLGPGKHHVTETELINKYNQDYTILFFNEIDIELKKYEKDDINMSNEINYNGNIITNNNNGNGDLFSQSGDNSTQINKKILLNQRQNDILKEIEIVKEEIKKAETQENDEKILKDISEIKECLGTLEDEVKKGEEPKKFLNRFLVDKISIPYLVNQLPSLTTALTSLTSLL